MNTARRTAINAAVNAFGVAFRKHPTPDRADKVVRIKGQEFRRAEAVDALRKIAADYRASGRTPEGYRRGDAVEAGVFELAAARVRVCP